MFTITQWIITAELVSGHYWKWDLFIYPRKNTNTYVHRKIRIYIHGQNSQQVISQNNLDIILGQTLIHMFSFWSKKKLKDQQIYGSDFPPRKKLYDR